MLINGTAFPARPDTFEVEAVRAEQATRTITNRFRYLRLGPPKRRWRGRTRPLPRADAEGWLALDGQVVTAEIGPEIMTARFSAYIRPWGATALWEVLFELEEV